MSEYNGFQYQLKHGTAWWLVYPSGFKTTVHAADEVALKALIDEIIAAHL